ncbi:Alpha/Beta hydrolase protein [Mycena latifolia]|nr:Alpha/Beta hydrolase protein [Mycena latifolia]
MLHAKCREHVRSGAEGVFGIVTFSSPAGEVRLEDLTAPEPKNAGLVDTVWEPRKSDGFPGLYLDANLPVSPFNQLGEKAYLIFGSTWGSRTTIFSPTIPPKLVLGEFKPLGEVSWRVIHSPYIVPSLQTALSSLSYSVVSIPERGKVQTVWPSRRNDHRVPPTTVFLALEGYTVSSPNYTGSVGFGESFVGTLLGNCGTLDVEDCIATVRHLVKIGLSAGDKGKQFLICGSPGGFLTAHLIGQLPDVFSAAVIRSPVISTDPLSSDIPDWYFNEWNIDFPIYSSPEGFPEAAESNRPLPLSPRRTPAESQRIFSSSPIAYVDAVTAPVLLHLGDSDLRMTPTHGLEYYHALKGKARNEWLEQDVEMHWFEKGGHSLDGVETGRIVWETSRDWFNKYRV